MICSRCGKESDTDRMERNAEIFDSNIYACPYCGKAHYFKCVKQVVVIPCNSKQEEDDWGNVIISDEEYEKVKRLKK